MAAISYLALCFEDIKRHFGNNPPPDSMDLKPCQILDTRKFLNSCHVTIANFKGSSITYYAGAP